MYASIGLDECGHDAELDLG